jgi:hypothetical protein
LVINGLQLARFLNIKNGNLARFLLVPNKKLKKYLDRIEIVLYIKNMKQDMVSRYEWAKVRFEMGWITQEEWFKICFEILGEVMEENKDVLVRLKNR